MCDRKGGPRQNGLEPGNWVLASLTHQDLWRLRPYLELVALRPGEVLLEAGEALPRAYFVEAGVVALVTVFEDGTSAVSALAGREGVVGVGALLGGDVELGRYVVHVTGSALAMEVSRFRAALRQCPRLRTSCQAYARALLGQALQNTACHSAHTVAERYARSLLVIRDRIDDDTLALTHDALAQMLGVRPADAACMTRSLHKAGLVRYRDGGIRVLDRARLEAAACECYAIDRARCRRLLPGAFDRREPAPFG